MVKQISSLYDQLIKKTNLFLIWPLKVFYDVSIGRETKSTLGYAQFRKLSLAVAKEEKEPFLTLSNKKNAS